MERMWKEEYFVWETREFLAYFSYDSIWEESFSECYSDGFCFWSLLGRIAQDGIWENICFISELLSCFLALPIAYCYLGSCKYSPRKRSQFIDLSTDAQRQIGNRFFEKFCQSRSHGPEAERGVPFLTFCIEESSATNIDMVTVPHESESFPEESDIS